MDSFIASGKALGLEGKALTDFVEAKEAARIEREERKEREKLEREEKKAAEMLAREEKKEAERLDREAKSEAQRLARKERAKEREIKLAETQAQEKEKEREYELAKHEIEMKVQILEKQIELEKVHKSGFSGIGDKSQDVKAKIPKLPPFNKAHSNFCSDNSEMAHVQSDSCKDVCQENIDGKPRDVTAILERYCYFCQSPSHMVKDLSILT